jgi:hypothetical protein
MNSISKCFEILGLPLSANLFEIKKAFRAKAKLLHPDKCNDADATVKFIQLTEAYETLVTYKEKGTISNPFATRAAQASRKAQQEAKQAEAKRKAKHAAKMKYEQFIQSDYYKTNLHIDILVDHFMFLLGVFVFVILPILLVNEMGSFGFVPWAFVVLFLGLFFVKPIMNIRNLSLRNLWAALVYIGKRKKASGIFFVAGTAVMYFQVMFKTIIPDDLYFILLLITAASTFTYCALSKKESYKNFKLFYAVCAAPFFFHCFFLVNYFVSFESKTESYRYRYEAMQGRGKRGTETYASVIHLQNDAYESYGMLRTFQGASTNGDSVVMKINRGIFGIRVVKKFNFYWARR